MKDIRFHIPLWKSYFGNDEVKRLYLRFEATFFDKWASGGKNKDGSYKIYRKGYEFRIDVQITHDKVEYPTTYEEY